MSNQPALQTSRGTIWLILGGILAAIAIAELAFLVHGPAGFVATVGIVIELALYLAMVVARFAVPSPLRRLRLLAGGMIALAAVAVVALYLVVDVLAAGNG